MDVALAYSKDVVSLEGLTTSRVKYPLDEGYYAIKNNSNNQIEIHTKDVGISLNDEGIVIPSRDGKLFPKINKETMIFIEGKSGDTIDIYHSLSKFPDNFLTDIYNAVSANFFCWDGTEVNATAEHYLTTAYTLTINFLTLYGRYARELHIYEPSQNLIISIKMKDDSGYKSGASASERVFVLPAGTWLNLPDKVDFLLESIIIRVSPSGSTAFNPYIWIW